MPMSARHAIHASADCTNIMPTMAGEVTKRRNERARRGPRMSQMKPVMARMTAFLSEHFPNEERMPGCTREVAEQLLEMAAYVAN